MGRALGNNLDRKVLPENSDIADNSFKNKSYSCTLKKTLDDVKKKEGTVDGDYKEFFKFDKRQALDDRQYEMFLKHLREDGKSYVLDITMSSEMCVLVKYEEEALLDNEIKRKPPKSLKNVPSEEKRGTPYDLRNVSSTKKVGTHETLSSVLSNERKRSVVQKNLKPERRDTVLCGTDRHSSQKPAPKVPCSQANRSSSQKPAPRVPCSPNPESNDETGYGSADEDFGVFLNRIKRDGNNLVHTDEDGTQYQLEVDYESLSDSDSDSDLVIVTANSAPYCDKGKYTPFVTSKLFVSSCIGSPDQSNHSQFRKKLMDVLSMPFDQKEFEDLMREASYRKPLQRDRHLRQGTKSYSVEGINKSYLDNYPALAKKINLVQGDRQRILNLLRGFFYWLKNISHEGSFPPWVDQSCLKAMLQQ